MKYDAVITLRDGRECRLRNGTEADGQTVLENFKLTHEETDFLLTYPEENTFDAAEEGAYLKQKEESPNEIEIVAFVGGKVAGTAGIEAIGTRQKNKHRAEFGVAVARAFCGLGIGRALLAACIDCAKRAGYEQLELDAVAENGRALLMYEKAGFVEFGRNPRGFKKKDGSYQELVYLRLEL